MNSLPLSESKTKEGKRAHPVHGGSYPLLTFATHPNTLRPTTGHIHSGESSQVEAIAALNTAGHQAHFQEARTVLSPVGKGAYCDTTLEQAAWLSST